MPLLISSIVLFYAGVAFAYFIVFPLVFNFLISVAPEGVAVMTDINKYLDFVLALFFAFGLAFEIPIATIILIAMGVTDADSLVAKRPYIIVGAFVIGMFLTPPDVISQIMLALPMWLLFEGGIIMSRVLIQPRDEDEETEDGTEFNAGAGKAAPAAAAAGASAASADAAEKPTGYSASAYPDDYKPLTWEEMEAEIDEASKWEDEDEDEDSEDSDIEDNGDEPKPESDVHDETTADDSEESEPDEDVDEKYEKRDDDIGP